MKIKNFIYFTPAIFYYALIFFISSKSYEIKVEVPFTDKGLHCLEFAVFSLFLSLGFFKSFKFSSKIKFLITLFSGISLGILDEAHQYFVPERHFDILDMAADGLGIIIGLCFYLYLSRKINL